tara:strand:- start:27183 stop:28073 length:891 start_codon:yes stop_codon:yes gene_type:complete
MINELTILTPTYNRGEQIKKLYDSLVSQGYSDLTWLIIDDGSTDNTKEVIQSFQEKSIFRILYFYKQNGGKVSAHKLGFEKLDTEWCMAVDSDDWLLEDRLCIIESLLKDSSIKTDAFCMHRYDPLKKKILGDKFKKDLKNYHDLYNSGIRGDKVHIHRSRLVKNVKINLFPPETYLSPHQLTFNFDKNINVCFKDIPITASIYLKSGLTGKIVFNRYSSPKGTSYTYLRISEDEDLSNKLRWKAKINYYRFKFLRNKKILKMKDIILYLFGFLMFLIDIKNDPSLMKLKKSNENK